jgi:hypothetical protein
MNDDTIEIQKSAAMNIATISAGFEKGDFLVREEQGNRVYFDFFEEVGLSCMLKKSEFRCAAFTMCSELTNFYVSIQFVPGRPSTTFRIRDMLA